MGSNELKSVDRIWIYIYFKNLADFNLLENLYDMFKDLYDIFRYLYEDFIVSISKQGDTYL